LKIIITIKTDNSAFSDDIDREVGRLLRVVAERQEQGRTVDGSKLIDVNGNTVGSVKVTGH
jgi:hypothetical protein